MKKIIFTSILLLYAFSASLTAYGASASETAVPAATEISETDIYAVTSEETTVPVVTDEKKAVYKTMGDLYQIWGGERYPDYVCGVWSNDGTMENLTVAVTKDEKGEEGKKEILSLIENTDSVKFTYMSHSYKELRQVQQGVEEILICETEAGNLSSWGVGVNEMQNIVHVDIYGDETVIKPIATKCFELYGDAVVFEAMSGAFTLNSSELGTVPVYGDDEYSRGGSVSASEKSDDTLEWHDDTAEHTAHEAGTGSVTAISVTTAEKKPDNLLLIITCAAAVTIVSGIGIFSYRKAKIRASSAGDITESVKLNRSQVEKILKESEEAPERDVLADVMKEFDG